MIIAKAIIPIEIFFLNEPVINSEKAKSIQIFPLWLEVKN